ncbi:NYN domain-containing protein [bacterium]|nr:NYN domain-containing protein [bacterium]
MPPPSQVPARVSFYIDGFNLYFGMKAKGFRKHYWLDLALLCNRLLRRGQNVASVKYFTARISPTPSNPKKHLRQSEYLDALAAHGGVQIIYGVYLAKTIKCKNCGTVFPKNEEKQTDVNIAVALLEDAAANLFDTEILITPDSDLAPAIESVRRTHPQKRVIVAFPPGRHSNKLKSISSGLLHVKERHLKSSQLPDPVLTPSGYAINKPTHWS